MKRVLALLLALVLLLALCACGTKKEQPAQIQPEQPAREENKLVKDTCILLEADEAMINNYSLLAVNPDAPFVDADGNPVQGVEINTAGAAALINWLLSEEGQGLAADYGMTDYGEHLFYLKEDRPVSAAQMPATTEETRRVRLSTTTSVNDSGLLSYLLPVFHDKYGYEIEVYSAGTGKAIANAKMGNADLILVHAKKQEEAFVADGFAYVLPGMESERMSYMYNYFVLCGPVSDPAGVKDAPDVLQAFQRIADGKHAFISRGDGSGTHTKELSLWPAELGISAEADSFKAFTDWYISANAGMAACLTMAREKHAYILTDKATFLTFRANGGAL
jgi:ABC-type tungstate transport system permease subunit